MFTTELSVVIAIGCTILAIVFFLGKGAGVINAFNGKNAPVQKKKKPEDERRYQRSFGVFCLILAIAELMNLILPIDKSVMGIISIVVVVLDLVFIVVYLKKNFPEG